MRDTKNRGTVFIVDDDPEIAELLRELISSIKITTMVFPDGIEFIQYCTDHPGDINGCLIIDMMMPYLTGMDVMTRIAAMGIRIPIIMISGHGDVSSAVQAMRLGAIDFIEKPFSPRIVIDRMQEALRINAEWTSQRKHSQSLAAKAASLTPREKEIYRIFLTGHHTKEIAARMRISIHTVNSHRSRISRKMGVDSVNQLIVVGLQVMDHL